MSLDVVSCYMCPDGDAVLRLVLSALLVLVCSFVSAPCVDTRLVFVFVLFSVLYMELLRCCEQHSDV